MPGRLQEAFDRIGAAARAPAAGDRTPPGRRSRSPTARRSSGSSVRGPRRRRRRDAGRAADPVPDRLDTKSFAALVAVQESAAGRLDLHVSRRRDPAVARAPEPFGPITLHHLMTHTAGLAHRRPRTRRPGAARSAAAQERRPPPRRASGPLLERRLEDRRRAWRRSPGRRSRPAHRAGMLQPLGMTATPAGGSPTRST